MKTLILAVAAILSVSTACANNNKNQQQMNEGNKKSLVVYYSQTGNTQTVAGKIQTLTGSDIFRIETVKEYPADYTATTEVAQREKNENARPELKGRVQNIEDYDVIYVGYPIWWGTPPMAVFTFLESYDLKGKIIVPFATHGGGGIGTSVQDIKRILPGIDVKDGLSLRGGSVNSSDPQIESWLERLGMIE